MRVRVGRPKGRENLKRTSRGSVILPNGERITPKEQRALKSAVVSANRKRRILIQNLPKQATQRYKDFGIDSDFVMRKKSASLGRFRNRSEFESYLKSLQKINKTDYLSGVVDTYRQNLNRAIDKVFNSAGEPLKEFINSLSTEELRELTLDESFKDIGYVYYEPVAVSQKLKTLRYEVTIIRNRQARTGHKGKSGRV